MKTIKVDDASPSVGELLALARHETLVLVLPDGTRFVLEEADDFDREIAELGASEKFMNFLQARSKEKGVSTIEEYADGLGAEDV